MEHLVYLAADSEMLLISTSFNYIERFINEQSDPQRSLLKMKAENSCYKLFKQKHTFFISKFSNNMRIEVNFRQCYMCIKLILQGKFV